jgi:Ni/Co efflux regulator RcnB
MMKKLMLGAAALAITATPLAASAADWGHGRGDCGRGWDRGGEWRDRGDRDDGNGGAALAAGLFGFVLGSALNHDRYDGYYQSCYWTTRPVEDAWGYVHYQRVEVCR